MKKIIMIRHGEASHLIGEKPYTGGWTDNPLTDQGLEQAKKEAKRLIADNIDASEFRMYASALLRAKTTAEIISNEMGIDYFLFWNNIGALV